MNTDHEYEEAEGTEVLRSHYGVRLGRQRPWRVETRDLEQDILLDYDGQGSVVGITIEHVKTRIGGPRMELETVQVQQSGLDQPATAARSDA